MKRPVLLLWNLTGGLVLTAYVWFGIAPMPAQLLFALVERI
jgi:hypothetical protein